MKGKERVHNKVLHSDKLYVLLSNIKIGKNCVPGTNTLAYLEKYNKLCKQGVCLGNGTP
jgi:hypothetical protein